MIKGVIFDFFDVIRTDAYKSWLSANGIPYEGPYLSAARQHDLGTVTTEGFIKIVGELAGRQVTLEEIDHVSRVDQAVVKIIAELQKSYKLALLSNASSALIREILSEHNLEQYFDVIIVSSEVGMIKPDPEIFKLALSKLDMSPEEAIFIDDNARYVTAAEELGIVGIQFQSAIQLRAALTDLDIKL